MHRELSDLLDKYLAVYTGVPPERLADRDARIADLGVQPHDVVEAVKALAFRYGLRVDDADAFHALTLHDAVERLYVLMRR